jgi:hypothetical protein
LFKIVIYTTGDGYESDVGVTRSLGRCASTRTRLPEVVFPNKPSPVVQKKDARLPSTTKYQYKQAFSPIFLLEGCPPPVPAASFGLKKRIPPMGRGSLGRLEGTDRGAAVMTFQEGHKRVQSMHFATPPPGRKTTCMHSAHRAHATYYRPACLPLQCTWRNTRVHDCKLGQRCMAAARRLRAVYTQQNK